ncbi:NUDIX domain-containing protein [Nocardioides sp. Soil777]|uniref:NUDIX domain-containing protein n=1 Tax=Nocardioides sp. Soil777 TaxID=1736409 RepID=UPI001F322BC6|nr:NUDIX domain-containing protein [Nocardioides sp. Soil777]
MHTFASVAVVDHRGRVLMQERDEHARFDPDRWCLPGGGVEEGEDFRAAAVRELAEETGLVVEPHHLDSLGVTRFHNPACGGEDDFETFVVRLGVSDDDVVCGEGRQMVFVDPARFDDLPLVRAATLMLPRVLEWRDATGQHLFAGVLLVDPRGRLLLQERDEHPRIDPEKWGLPGGHLDPGEDFEPGAYRELEEETGVRLAPGTLEMWREFVVDHRSAYGTFDRMQVFVAATDLTDDDIECHEGRRIVFVDPVEARGLDLSSAAADIVPAFLDSPTYASMAP